MSEHNGETNDYLDNQNITKAAIQELLDTNSRLEGNVATISNMKKEWRQRKNALHNSNFKMGIQLSHFEKTVENLNQQNTEKSAKVLALRDEIAEYQQQKIDEVEDFRKKFEDQVSNFKALFMGAETEYSSENLKKDIEKYKEQSLILTNQISSVKKRSHEDNNKYGITELGTNPYTEILNNLEKTIKMLIDDVALTTAIRADENTIAELKRKINHEEREIANLVNKKK